MPIGLDRVTIARTPSLSTQHSPYQDGCFRCYHPFPQGARPERYPRASTERPPRALRPRSDRYIGQIASVPEKKSPIRTPEGAPDARGDARRLARPRPNARLNIPSHVFSSQVAFRGQTAELKRGKVVKVRIPASAAATSRVNSRQHGRASSPPPTRPSTRNADLPPLHSLLQAAAVNTTTEAKVKVAINGFGRIGASRSRQSEPFSLRLPIASQDVSRNAIGPTAVVPSTPSDRRLVRRPVASRGSTVPHLDGSLRPVPSHGPLRSRP